MGIADEILDDAAAKPATGSESRDRPSSIFTLANAVDPQMVADWLGVERDGRRVKHCPGCGASTGVDIIDRGMKCQHESCRGKGRNGFRSNVDLVMEVRSICKVDAAKSICEKAGIEVPDAYRRSTVARSKDEDAQQKTDPYTDLANAERLVEEEGNDLRFCGALGGWQVWDGRRFSRDTTGESERRAKRMLRRYLAKAEARLAVADKRLTAAKEKSDSERLAVAEADLRVAKKEYSWFANSQNARRIGYTLSVASSEASIATSPEAYDSHPFFLNVANGTIDLRDGTLHPHQRNNLITKLAPVVYDPSASAQRWTSFLEQILPDSSVREYVQRVVGYALCGEIREHVFPILYGVGANGKSTFVETIKMVVGDYAKTVSTDLFLVQRNEAHPTRIANLKGVRIAIAAESDQGSSLAESTLKQLTGGDTIAARYMYRDFFEFEPSHTFLFSTNHRPRIRGTDNGIWRRIALIPFAVTIPVEQRDSELKSKLAVDSSGILNWMLDGTRSWLRGGLQPPAAIIGPTEEYRGDEDTLAEFIEERCCCEDGATVGATPLYKAYLRYADESGLKPMTQRSFGEALSERGFVRRKTNGAKQYVGIRVATMKSSDE